MMAHSLVLYYLLLFIPLYDIIFVARKLAHNWNSENQS